MKAWILSAAFITISQPVFAATKIGSSLARCTSALAKVVDDFLSEKSHQKLSYPKKGIREFWEEQLEKKEPAILRIDEDHLILMIYPFFYEFERQKDREAEGHSYAWEVSRRFTAVYFPWKYFGRMNLLARSISSAQMEKQKDFFRTFLPSSEAKVTQTQFDPEAFFWTEPAAPYRVIVPFSRAEIAWSELRPHTFVLAGLSLASALYFADSQWGFPAFHYLSQFLTVSSSHRIIRVAYGFFTTPAPAVLFSLGTLATAINQLDGVGRKGFVHEDRADFHNAYPQAQIEPSTMESAEPATPSQWFSKNFPNGEFHFHTIGLTQPPIFEGVRSRSFVFSPSESEIHSENFLRDVIWGLHLQIQPSQALEVSGTWKFDEKSSGLDLRSRPVVITSLKLREGKAGSELQIEDPDLIWSFLEMLRANASIRFSENVPVEVRGRSLQRFQSLQVNREQ